MDIRQKTGSPSLSTSGKSAIQDRGNPAIGDSNTGQAETQPIVTPLLHPGEENAVSATSLCAILGCADRQLRYQVKDERESGLLILSTSAGYFLPSLDSGQAHDEILRCYKRLSSHAFGVFPFLRVLEHHLSINPQQLTINETGGTDG